MYAAERNPFSRQSREAFYAPEDLAFGILRMYAAFNAGSAVVFRNCDQARESEDGIADMFRVGIPHYNLHVTANPLAAGE